MSSGYSYVPIRDPKLISPGQICAARALLGWRQDKLAEVAGITRTELSNMEQGRVRDGRPDDLVYLRRVLERAGVKFLMRSTAGGEGVRLRDARQSMVSMPGSLRKTALVDERIAGA